MFIKHGLFWWKSQFRKFLTHGKTRYYFLHTFVIFLPQKLYLKHFGTVSNTVGICGGDYDSGRSFIWKSTSRILTKHKSIFWLHWITKSFTLSTATEDTSCWFGRAYETTDNPRLYNKYKCSHLCKLAVQHIGNCRLHKNTVLFGPQNFCTCCWPLAQRSPLLAALHTLLILCPGGGLTEKYCTIVYALLTNLITTVLVFFFFVFKISHLSAAD